MELDNDRKVDVLLELLKEKRRQVQWLKDLDFKIAYFTVSLLVAIMAWLGTAEQVKVPDCVLRVSVLSVSILALGFFLRNHSRHKGIRVENDNICQALLLMKVGEYDEQPILRKRSKRWWHDWPFWFGRLLYATVIAAAALSAWLSISYTLP